MNEDSIAVGICWYASVTVNLGAFVDVSDVGEAMANGR